MDSTNNNEGILGPEELLERGLGPGLFGPPSTPLEANIMDFNRAPIGGEYTPEEDVNETLPDGRVIQIAVKGVPMPLSDAVRAGIVKVDQQVTPQENKQGAGPAEAKPAEGGSEAKSDAKKADSDSGSAKK